MITMFIMVIRHYFQQLFCLTLISVSLLFWNLHIFKAVLIYVDKIM